MTTRVFLSFTIMLVLIAPPVSAQQPYVLGAEDIIEVAVYGQPDLTRVVTVLPDGTIALPLVGTIVAGGLSVDDLTRELVRAYSLYIRNPQVSIVVKEFRKISVSVLGQVVRPGIYALRPGATVLEALSAAGGLTENASVTEARLVRASGENQPLALDDLLIRQDMQYNVALQPGDTLLVPEELNSRFFVLGDVGRPGVYVLRGDVSVLQALAMAGGPMQRGVATPTTIHIVRRSGAPPQLPAAVGKVEKLPNNGMLISLNLQAVIQQGDLSRDMLVQPGDILVVPQTGLVNVSSVASILAGLALFFR